MAQPTVPIIALTQITLAEDKIRELIRVSRLVARWNGNFVNRRRIHLITDDFSLATAGLLPEDSRHVRSEHATQNTGLFWPHSGVMWLKPRDTNDVIKTLAHEVAHSVSPGHHPHTWRRAYSILLPLWWQAFYPSDTLTLNMWFEISHITRRYAKRMSATRRRDEVIRHVNASDRAFARWSHLV